LNAVRALVKSAQSERATMHETAPERAFYLGVEAAAEEVLRPELGVARADGWLDHESAMFRSGYLKTTDLLAAAMTSPEPPQRLLLPEPTP
jgi:hypothetical protein